MSVFDHAHQLSQVFEAACGDAVRKLGHAIRAAEEVAILDLDKVVLVAPLKQIDARLLLTIPHFPFERRGGVDAFDEA